MQIWSLIITFLSAAVRLNDKGKCAETVTVFTNQTDVDETYSPSTFTWSRGVRESPLNVTFFKARKIVKRQASGQNDSSDSSTAAATEDHQEQQHDISDLQRQNQQPSEKEAQSYQAEDSGNKQHVYQSEFYAGCIREGYQ